MTDETLLHYVNRGRSDWIITIWQGWPGDYYVRFIVRTKMRIMLDEVAVWIGDDWVGSPRWHPRRSRVPEDILQAVESRLKQPVQRSLP